MRFALSPLAALLFCACTTHVVVPKMVPAPSADPYVEALVQKADALRLADQKQWLRLGHYREGAFAGAPLSEADSPAFFLAQGGREDPRAELHATIRGFFLPPMQEVKADDRGDPKHPLCRFPARFMWLAEQLQIDPARLPKQECAPFFRFLQQIDPASVSVIFSSYYLNNPASAFGHTFLRFNKARTLASGQKRELLDYAVDFAADVDTGNAFIYAVKGLLGAFPGTVKRMPYYYKVRTYADFESRDMWEYELNLTPQQLFMLVAHIWEIGPAYFAYFYLDENCSYRINMMLEAADPDIDLVTHMQSPVLPADTVKVLFDNPGLVKRVSYRPSLRTTFMRAAKDLDGDEAELVLELAADARAPLPKDWPVARQVKVLDAALDYFDMRNVEKIVHERESPEAAHKQVLLERRAALRVPSTPKDAEPPWQRRPELSHDAKRVGVAPGYRLRRGAAEEGFVAFDFKLAMHDLADPAPGFPEQSQIDFLPTRLRLYPKSDGLKVRLEDFSVVQIVSLNPMHRFDLGLSWRFTIGAKTLENNGCKDETEPGWRDCLAGKIRLGGGAAKSIANDALIVFLMMDAAVFVGDLSGIAESPLRAGVGPLGGLRIRFDPRLIFVATGDALWFPEQQDRIVWQGDGTLRWGFAEQHALSLESRVADRLLEAQLFYLAYL
jgi:hypothetical protein